MLWPEDLSLRNSSQSTTTRDSMTLHTHLECLGEEGEREREREREREEGGREGEAGRKKKSYS